MGSMMTGSFNRPCALPPTAVLGVVTSLLLATQYEWPVYATFAGVFLMGMIPYVMVWRNRKGAGGRDGKPPAA